MPQQALDARTVPTLKPPDFSLVLGGPLFQTYRRAHLSGDSLELLHRRVLVIALLAWLPLFVLSVVNGDAAAGAIKIPFLHDVEAHVRFLLAVPLLIVGEVVVHVRISPLVRRFVDRRIVGADDVPKFNAAVTSAIRVRNSFALEAALLILVYTFGRWLWESQLALTGATWYARPDAERLQLTAAGYWYAFVSIPIFQFLLVRWYARLVLWFWFLWRIARLNLQLTATHPDRSGGIGFLGSSGYAFSPILVAQSMTTAGMIANRVLYRGDSLTSFSVEVVSLISVLVLFVLGPLVMFTPQLDRAGRKGAAEFGLLASRYASRFDAKWLQAGKDMRDLLGTGDIQSLADLANSYTVVSGMRLVPFGRDDVTRIVAVTAAPLLPLALTMVPLQELLTRVLKLLL